MSGSPSLPVPGRDDPRDDVAELGGGDLGGVVGRAEPDRVQRQRPRRAARLQRRDPGVRPARDHLRVPLPARVAVAEQPLRAGLRVRPQPVAHVAGQPDPAVRPTRRSGSADSARRSRAITDLPAVQRVVDAAVPAAALRLQAQLREHQHPLRPARQRVADLEQRIAAHAQASSTARCRNPASRADAVDPPRPRPVLAPGHNESHGHRLASSGSVEGTRRSSSGGRLMSPRHAGQHKQLRTAQTTRVK